MAAIVVAGQSLTIADATAELATPVIAAACGGRARAGHRAAPATPAGLGAGGRGGGVRRLRGADRALRGGHLRRLHQARRHRHLDGLHRPGDGARPRPRRAGAVDVRGDPRVQPRRRLSGRASSCRWGSGRPWSARTWPGWSSPTWRSGRRCWRSPSARSRAVAVRGPRGHVRPSRSWPPSRRCSSATTCGAGSRRSRRSPSSPRSPHCCPPAIRPGPVRAVVPPALIGAGRWSGSSAAGAWCGSAPLLAVAAIVGVAARGPGARLAGAPRSSRRGRGSRALPVLLAGGAPATDLVAAHGLRTRIGNLGGAARCLRRSPGSGPRATSASSPHRACSLTPLVGSWPSARRPGSWPRGGGAPGGPPRSSAATLPRRRCHRARRLALGRGQGARDRLGGGARSPRSLGAVALWGSRRAAVARRRSRSSSPAASCGRTPSPIATSTSRRATSSPSSRRSAG